MNIRPEKLLFPAFAVFLFIGFLVDVGPQCGFHFLESLLIFGSIFMVGFFSGFMLNR